MTPSRSFAMSPVPRGSGRRAAGGNEALGDCDHRLGRELVVERVVDPDDRSAGGLAGRAAVEDRDAMDRRAVRVDADEAPLLARLPADLAARLLEDRRVGPG